MCVFWSHKDVRRIYVKVHEFCMNDVRCVNMKLSWMNKKQNRWNSNYNKFSWINEVQIMINFHEWVKSSWNELIDFYKWVKSSWNELINFHE